VITTTPEKLESVAVESRLSELERAELDVVSRFAAPDRHISEDEVPWFPWVGPIEIKVLRADNRTGNFVVGLRSGEDAVLGKHRHRGPVSAVTLRGRWEYFEYDWVAKPGDYVRENPGTIHTLHVFANTEIVFTVDGSIEFLKVRRDAEQHDGRVEHRPSLRGVLQVQRSAAERAHLLLTAATDRARLKNDKRPLSSWGG
jgi:quercetin dioxygenase-like cupin family protein